MIVIMVMAIMVVMMMVMMVLVVGEEANDENALEWRYQPVLPAFCSPGSSNAIYMGAVTFWEVS